jgi:hypothetical protein
MSTQIQSGIVNTNQVNPGFPIVGSDASGANLVIRSTNNTLKGSVLFDETTPSYSSNTGAIQTLGGIGAQHNISTGGTFMNMPYGYSVNNILVAPTLGGDYRGYYNMVGTVSAAWSNGVVTMTFQSQNAPPFIVGQFITVTGCTPVAYNGNWQVVSCNQTTVSWYFGTSSPGALSVFGYMFQSWAGGATTPQFNITAPQLANGVPALVVPIMNNVTLNVVATVSGTGSVATIPFATQALPPFVVGQQIYVSNVTPTGYNGIYTVTACTTSSVSYSNSTTGAVGFVTGAGTVSSGYIVGTNVINPGTGYSNVPAVSVTDPVPNQANTIQWVAGNAIASGAIPQALGTTSANGTGTITLGSPTTLSAVASGATVTVVSTSGFYTGQPVVISGLPASGAGGLTNGTWYFISTGAGGNCNLATSVTNAVWNIPFQFTSSTGLSATMTPTLPDFIRGGFVTIGFSTLSSGINIVPFYPGQSITIQGTTNSGGVPQGYNGTWQVYTATTTSVTISSNFQGSLSVNGVITSAANNTTPLFVKVPAGSGIFNFYQVSYPGTLGTSAPTHTYGTQLPTGGSAGLTYIGQDATAYASIGYSGIVTQGCVHQVGCVTQIIITTAGAGYGSAPLIQLGRPDLPGGRQALAVCSISGGAIQFVTIVDAGSGYLYPPTATFVSQGGTAPSTVATGTVVIGNPGEKPIVSTLVPAVATGTGANRYSLDFGLTGHNVVFLATGVNSTFDFDNLIAAGATPYTKGFPLGRRIILYVKNTHNATITLTFTNLVNNNAGTSTNSVSLTANRTAKCEFIVLSQGNLIVPGTSYTAVQSYAGGSANDVYATFTLT